MRETSCPQCRGAARLVSNPYYGAGLAVHRDLLVCEACGYSGFADNGDPPPVAPSPRLSAGLVARLLARLRRR